MAPYFRYGEICFLPLGQWGHRPSSASLRGRLSSIEHGNSGHLLETSATTPWQLGRCHSTRWAVSKEVILWGVGSTGDHGTPAPTVSAPRRLRNRQLTPARLCIPSARSNYSCARAAGNDARAAVTDARATVSDTRATGADARATGADTKAAVGTDAGAAGTNSRTGSINFC